jgi:hypothetical protein
LQNDDKLNISQNLSESGFIFSSFDTNKKILIPKNNSQEISADFISESINFRWYASFTLGFLVLKFFIFEIKRRF